jgi:hypothetical protein
VSIIVIGNVTPTSFSLLTLADLERKAAQVAGAGMTPDQVGARDAVQEVMAELNENQWEFNTVRASDIALFDYRTKTSGQEGYQGQYSIPLPMRDFVSARVRFGSLTEGGWPIYKIRRDEFDRKRTAYSGTLGLTVDDSSQAGTRYFTTFATGQTGKIELLDPPVAAGTLEIRYYALIPPLVQPTDRLFVPANGPLESYVSMMARANVANNIGLSGRRDWATGKAAQLLAEAKNQDRDGLNQDDTWEPEEVSDPYKERAKRWGGYGTWGG